MAIRPFSLLMGFWLLPALGLAQNPFDLVPRLDQADTALQRGVAESSNPFDIVLPPPGLNPTPQLSAPIVAPQVPAVKPSFTPDDNYRRFLFGLVIGLLVLLTVLVTLFRGVLQKVYRAFLNQNMLGQLQREQGRGLSWPLLIFYLFFFVNAGVFIFLGSEHQGMGIAPNHWASLGLATLGVGVLFAGKHLLLWFIQAVFPVRKEILTYSFTMVIFGIVLGFILLPFNIFLVYGPESWVSGILWMGLISVALVYAFRTLRGMLIAARFIAFQKFHFLLYICTVEIAPVAIIAKLLLAGTN